MLDEVVSRDEVESSGLVRNWINGKIAASNIHVGVIANITSINNVRAEWIQGSTPASKIQCLPWSRMRETFEG